ncbi:MAG: hypothetical protein IKX23_02770 [Treponema sp.]|nr:hypothetical protein [Treponema sp.]
MEKIKIIKSPDELKPYIILCKPHGLPSAPLSDNDKNNALYQAATLFPQILEVKGRKEIEHGLIHRLDTATEGLMIIAVTQKCYDDLLKLQINNKITKYYSAECNDIKNNAQLLQGFPPLNSDCNQKKIFVQSYFRNYGIKNKEVRPVTEDSGRIIQKKVNAKKIYSTQIEIIKKDKEKIYTRCMITNGYRHQVRCHLAWCGLPVINDMLYNSRCTTEKNESLAMDLKFRADKISFEYPEGDLNSYVL